MNVNFYVRVKLVNELVQRYFKMYNNNLLDESQKIRTIIWKVEQSNRDEIYE